jgi:predicted membrane-bound dolichyl-phosphate-mannose-protein mannosyltransferase
MQGQGETYPRTAYLLSLIGGILLLIFSLIYAAVLVALASLFAAVGFGLGSGILVALAVVALVFGVLVLFFATRLKSNPGSAKIYGLLIVVFSLISFAGGGGFYIGAILALIGGILAIIWHPPAPAQQAWGQQPVAPSAPLGWGSQPPAAPPPS